MSASRSIVEPLCFILADEILNYCKNQPLHLVFYAYHKTINLNAVPLVMVSKYEADMTDSQFKVRVWDAEVGWEYARPILVGVHQTAAFIARSLTPEACCELVVGVRKFKGEVKNVNPVPVDRVHHRSTAVEWLSDNPCQLADYLYELGDPDWDDDNSRGEWVEEDDHFEELLEEKIVLEINRAFP